LGGTGAALMVGLPLLETLQARKAQAAATAGTPRLLCIGAGNGVPMDEFEPNGAGQDYTFKTGSGAWGASTIWSSFAALRSKTSIFTGLQIDEGFYSPGDHGAGMPAIFTCVKPAPQFANTNEQDYKDPNPKPAKLGISIDQLMAQKYAAVTPRLPMGLQVSMAKGLPLGDGPFGPTYLENLSWKSETEWNPPQLDPVQVFNKIFAGYDPNASAEENARRLARRTSILDYVQEEGNSLLPALNKDDRTRLDQYFTAARELELQLTAGQMPGGGGGGELTCAQGSPPASGLDYPSRVKAMADLVVLALTCDVTRSVMFQLSCYRNDTMFGFMDDPKVNDNHHSLSHAGDNKAADSGWRKVNRWNFDQIAYLLGKLDAVQEPNGLSILDNSLAVFNSDCGDGASHDHWNLPVVVWGSAGGKFPTGRYFEFPLTNPRENRTQAAGLYVSVLNALGVDNVQGFGSQQAGPLDLG
jgi:hypothetical protein